MSKNMIQDFAERLENSEAPHLVLASLFEALFERSIKPTEWGILRKYIKLYGKSMVFDAILRTASSPNFDSSKNIWGYVNAVILGLLEQERERGKTQLSHEESLNRTLDIVKWLKSEKVHDLKKITLEEFNSDSVKQ